MKAESTVRRKLAYLRKHFIKDNPDLVLVRVAQGIEYGIRWAREDTRGWPSPNLEAVVLAQLIREEID
jgi:hypothetical protein